MCISRLESRKLLSGSAHVSGHGTLLVEGTSGNDAILVRLKDGSDRAIIEINGHSEEIALQTFARVRIDGLGGNDHLQTDLARRTTIAGGDGDDALAPGPTADSIEGGAGSDTIDYYASTQPVRFTIRRFPLGDPASEASVAQVGAVVDQIGSDIEKFVGTTGNDRFDLRVETNDVQEITLDGRGGNDVFYAAGENLFVTLLGGAGKDRFVLDEGPDYVITGGSGGQRYNYWLRAS